MTLGQLTRLARIDIENEIAELRDDHRRAPGDPRRRRSCSGASSRRSCSRSGSSSPPRAASKITLDYGDIDIEDLIDDEELVVTLSTKGYTKTVASDTFRAQGRGGKGVAGAKLRDDDYVTHILTTTAHAYLLFFSNLGRVYRLKAHEIPKKERTARGTAIVNLLQLQPGEHIQAIIDTRDYETQPYLFFATKKGQVKKTTFNEYDSSLRTGLIAINLRDGDELVKVIPTNGGDDILMITKLGQGIRFNEDDVRPMGRAAAGVRGMKMRAGDEVVSLDTVPRRRRHADRHRRRLRQAHEARALQPPGPRRPGRAGHQAHRQEGPRRRRVHGRPRRRDLRHQLGRHRDPHGGPRHHSPGPRRHRRAGHGPRRRPDGGRGGAGAPGRRRDLTRPTPTLDADGAATPAELLEDRLGDLPFLRGLPPTVRAALALRCTPVALARRAAVVRRPAMPSDALLPRGRRLARRRGSRRRDRELRRCSAPAASSGEVGLLLDAPRSTVRPGDDRRAAVARSTAPTSTPLVAQHPQRRHRPGQGDRPPPARRRRPAGPAPPRIAVVPSRRAPSSWPCASAGEPRPGGVGDPRPRRRHDPVRELPAARAAPSSGTTPNRRRSSSSPPSRPTTSPSSSSPCRPAPTPAALAAAEVADLGGRRWRRPLPPWAFPQLRRRSGACPAPASPAELRRVARWVERAGRRAGAVERRQPRRSPTSASLQVLREAGIIDRRRRRHERRVGDGDGGRVRVHDAPRSSTTCGSCPAAFRYRRLGPRFPHATALFTRLGACVELFERWSAERRPRRRRRAALRRRRRRRHRAGGRAPVGPGGARGAGEHGHPRGSSRRCLRDGVWLTDGGIVTPLPARVLRDAGVGIVLASNVAGQDPRPSDGSGRRSLIETVGRMVSSHRAPGAGQPGRRRPTSSCGRCCGPPTASTSDHLDEYLAEGRRAARGGAAGDRAGPGGLRDLTRRSGHQVSMQGRFLPVRGGGGGAAASAVVIQRRESAGSITSSISK